MTILPVAALVLLFAGAARAAAPDGVDLNGPVAKWVQTWSNAFHEGCCGLESDCRPTALQPNPSSPSGWDAWIDKFTFGSTAPDRWVHVPEKAFSPSGENNPTGVSWACWYQAEVRCASLASGT